MYSGSFRSPRPAGWAQIESDRMDALLTRSFPTSTTHNAGGGRRVLLDEGEDVEHKAPPQTLKPLDMLPLPPDEARHSHSESPPTQRLLSLSRPACVQEESAVPPKRRSLQPEETQKAIVRFTLEGRSPSDINVLLEQGGFRNSTGPWTKSAGSDLMVIKRIIAKNGLKEGGSTSAAAPAAAAAAAAPAASAAPAPAAEPSTEDRAEDRAEDEEVVELLPAPIKALRERIGNERPWMSSSPSGRPASSLHHLLPKAPRIPYLTVTSAEDITDEIADVFVEKMISSHRPPTLPEVLGESSAGDMWKHFAWERACSTGSYAVSNGFVEHGGDILGMIHFGISNPDYYTFVRTVQQGMAIEQLLRDAWEARWGGKSDDIFLAQPNKGSGGGMGVPDVDARKFVMYFYAHQMNDMVKATKKSKRSKK